MSRAVRGSEQVLPEQRLVDGTPDFPTGYGILYRTVSPHIRTVKTAACHACQASAPLWIVRTVR